jgi:hypothetical protein
VFRLDVAGLRYSIRKQTEQRETLVFRQLREPIPAGERARSRIRVEVFGPERIERTPHDSWTYRRNVYDLRSALAPRFPVIWTDGEWLEEGETFYLSLGVDQGPGDYEIVLALEDGPPCYLQLLRVAPGKKDARRVFREERTEAGGNGR